MEPFYSDNWVKIYLGKCEDVLLDLPSVDLLITDPPYGIQRDGQRPSNGKHGGRKGYEFYGWDSQRPTEEAFTLMLSKSSRQVIWGGNYFADLLPPSSGWLVWDKGQRINQSDGELAWTSLDQALRIYTLNRMALMQDGAWHPTQKPEALIAWCINFFPTVKDIGDFYCGSGTTLRCAKDMGIPSIGIEANERYAEIAAKRMSQDVLWSVTQPELITA